MLHLKESVVGKPERGTMGPPKHRGMTAEQWKKVPYWIDNPVTVFKSKRPTGELVLIAPELVDGKPVRIILEPDEGMDVHVLANVVVEGTDSGNPFYQWV